MPNNSITSCEFYIHFIFLGFQCMLITLINNVDIKICILLDFLISFINIEIN